MTAVPLYRYRLYTPEFAVNQAAHYRHMRAEYKDVVPVEVSPGVHGHLVIGYWAAMELLRDPQTWSRDSTRWARTVPASSPILGMLGPRPNPLFTDGVAHERYRRILTDVFDMVEPHHLRDLVRDVADHLIDQFSAVGRADLVTQFSQPLPSFVFNRLLGQSDEASPRLVQALAGLLESGEGAAVSAREFEAYVSRLIAAKKEQPGQDLTSWVLSHPEQLKDHEMLPQVALAIAAGQEPTTNLIANTLALMLSDDHYYNGLAHGALGVEHAVHRVLREQPPIANYAAHYPRHDVVFRGTTIKAHTLVMVSFAAASCDPEGPGGEAESGAGAHLAWSAGPHACPVRGQALLITTTAVEQLVRRCTDLELSVSPEQLRPRVGPFHTALAAIPAHFTPFKATPPSDVYARSRNPFFPPSAAGVYPPAGRSREA